MVSGASLQDVQEMLQRINTVPLMLVTASASEKKKGELFAGVMGSVDTVKAPNTNYKMARTGYGFGYHDQHYRKNSRARHMSVT